jgi:tetratricopeptide (TPR) repeat protein
MGGCLTVSSTANDDESVRHLVALGYVDPELMSLRERSLRQQLEAEFQQALKLYQSDDLRAAIEQFERLAAEDPDWVAPRQVLVESYYRAGRPADAGRHLAWLTQHGVEHPRLALVEGALALGRRELEQAQDALEYAAHVEPKLPSVHTLLGMVYFRRGKLAEADASFDRALELNLADTRALDGRAAIHLRRGEFAEAADLSLQALEQDMQFFRAHYQLGVALVRLDRLKEAQVAFESAARVGTQHAAPYYWLTRIARADGNLSAAAAYRTAAQRTIKTRRDARATATQ